MNAMHVLVMAKAPVVGRVKTRLTPILTPAQATNLALASLRDTLDAVLSCGATRRLLALDGPVGSWLPDGFEVFEQTGEGFDRRLAAAWDRAGGPGLQIGTDTPQVSAQLIDGCLNELNQPGVDAVLGLAEDGGWWAIGLRRPDSAVFDGVPMSVSDTGHHQLARLRSLGLRTTMLPMLRDFDTVDDLQAVSAAAPSSRFTAAFQALEGPARTSRVGQEKDS